MSRKCDLSGKSPMSGNNVSHAVNKTRRRFLPNLQQYRLMSDILGEAISLRLSASTVRTIDRCGGLDSYILGLRARDLTEVGSRLKRRILRKQKSI